MGRKCFAAGLAALVAAAGLAGANVCGSAAAARAAIVTDGALPAANVSYDLTAGGGLGLAAPAGQMGDAGAPAGYEVAVDGDLQTADRIAVIVPGVGGNFEGAELHAEALQNELTQIGVSGDTSATLPTSYRTATMARVETATANGAMGGVESATRRTTTGTVPAATLLGGGTAVITWLGYTPPKELVTAATSTAGITQGAANLAALQDYLEHIRPAARVTWACHSWGTLVCASALNAADPAALVLVGSPGLPYQTAAAMPTTAPIYAGQGDRDPVAQVPDFDGLGMDFGTAPASAAFGAHIIPTDQGCGHFDYFEPGTTQLAAIAAVVARGA
ncbi:MAG: alpha/beta hydrolase family protein [Bifidobacteriaceae bacterium]|nr:alpha/beta hydrolase family protein [Bifidobacteriaceae bacterium]